MSKRAIWCSVICYIPPLFIAALLLERDDPIVRYHANQGLLLTIMSMVFSAAVWLVRLLGRVFFFFIAPVFNIIAAAISGILGMIILIYAVIGIINAFSKKCRPLPIIGDIEIIK